MPRSIRSWTLITLCEKVVNIETKVVTHAMYVNFQVAEVQSHEATNKKDEADTFRDQLEERNAVQKKPKL
jgi:hypothetical protein